MISIRLILLLFIFSACGKNIELPKEDDKVTSTTFSNSPVLLKLQDAQCIGSNTLIKNPAYKLYIYLRGRHEVLEKNFGFLKSSNPLRNSSIIKATYYGEEVETLFSYGRNQTFVNTPREELSLCSSTKDYSPLTVESVALNASFYINKTNEKFTELFPRISVRPIILNILPKIQRSYLAKNMSGKLVKMSSYLTDNAFYVVKDSSITFLPHSVDMKRMGFSANLWEVPMVISHEYGHHLFQTIFKGQSDTMGAHNCFGNHSDEDEIKNKRLTFRQVQLSDILNAYNEGFADLVSFYSIGSEFSLGGVRCLEITRDVNSNTFFNGSLKVFGERALESLFSDVKVQNTTCESSNYQEPHTIGAIFAYSADSYMNLFTDSKDKKFEVIVNWLNYLALNKNKYSRLTPQEYLKETFSIFLRIATTRLEGSFSEAACEKIYTMYPSLELQECNY